MRILLVSSSSGSRGEGEQYLIGLGHGLAQLGHDVETGMSAHARMDELAARCVPFGAVTRLDYCNTYDRLLRSGGAVLARPTIRRMEKFFRERQPEVIHINKQNVEDALDLQLAANRAGIPVVATVHIARSMSQLRARAGALRDWMANRVLCREPSHYITVAGHCSEQLLECCRQLERERVHAIWNGVSPAPDADRQLVREQWGCHDSDIVLGCVARLEKQKDPLFALELLRKLPRHVHLAWVGDGRLRAEFLKATSVCGLSHRVHFDGWKAEARSRMAGFDIFILPSEYEGFPFAVLEAMAASLPCVVSDVDGTREAVVDGLTGYLCPTRQAKPWHERLTELTTDYGKRQRMGRQGLERWREHFSLEAMARATVQVYEKVLARTRVAVP